MSFPLKASLKDKSLFHFVARWISHCAEILRILRTTTLLLGKLKLNVRGELSNTNKRRNVLLIVNIQIQHCYSILTPSYLQFANPNPAHLSKDLKKLNQKASSRELQHNLISTSLHSLHTPIRTHKRLHKNEYRKGQKGCCSILAFWHWENATHLSHIVRRRRAGSVLPSFLVRVWCRPSSKPSRIFSS